MPPHDQDDPLARIRASLEKLDRANRDLERVALTLSHHSIIPKIDVRSWPKPGPPLPPEPLAPERPRPGDPSADTLSARWQAGGLGWLRAAERGELRGLRVALRDRYDDRFVTAPGLLEALLDALRPRDKLRLAADLYFLRWPPPAALEGICADPQLLPPPRWWARLPNMALPDAGAAARSIAEAVRSGEARRPAELGLPPLPTECELAIAQAAVPRDAKHAEALLEFLDDGPIGRPAPVREGAAVALRALVAAAERKERPRREVAQRLALRVGSPFGVGAAGQWLAVKELLPKVRAWLAGEVLEVLFGQLLPDNQFQHHLGPRRDFWKRYTGSVIRMWVAVSPPIRRRGALQHPDVMAIRAAMGADLDIRALSGGAEQALIWMHLQTLQGNVVTVVEGNANTSLRMRAGEVAPLPGPIQYTQVKDYQFNRGAIGVETIQHNAGWDTRAGEFLRANGVFPS
jgi:hypothetical protein